MSDAPSARLLDETNRSSRLLIAVMTSAVNLYAEFLLNIRQVTIFATLQNDRNDESKALITSDRKSITVTHDGNSGRIIFPSGISGKALVHLPVSKDKLVSLRLEIVEDDKPSLGIGLEVANDSPWPARVLSNSTQVACRTCRSIILPAGDRIWKDLPRNDWAEMMDFWHCHKPHSEFTAGAEAPNNKGYAATNKPILRRGLGFIDTCHVLIHENECSGLNVSE